MLKKLTEEQQAVILSSAIDEFGIMGPERASIRSIAKRAGVSVGVIYKYYTDKDDLFEACLKESLDYLNEVIETAADGKGEHGPLDLREIAGNLITSCQRSAREYPSYFRMYNAITMTSGETAGKYAQEIEKMTAEMYTKSIRKAQEKGVLRDDLDPEIIAFFFDNILMMLHFSYSAGYYTERMAQYGIFRDDETKDEKIKDALLGMLFEGIGRRDK